MGNTCQPVNIDDSKSKCISKAFNENALLAESSLKYLADTTTSSSASGSNDSINSSNSLDSLHNNKIKYYYNRLYDEVETIVNQKYIFKSQIGDGASAKVYLVKDKSTGINYACKIVKISEMNDSETMRTELNILKEANHKSIVEVFEIYEAVSCLWIIMELAYNSLESVFEKCLKDNKTPRNGSCFGTVEQIVSMYKQLLQGLSYLHSIGVIHRDLKLDNILVTGEDSNGLIVKISDFGLSKKVDISNDAVRYSWQTKGYNKLTERWGNMDHFAPELINRAYGPQADVWALGCVFYEILTNEKLFDTYQLKQTSPTNLSVYTKLFDAQTKFSHKSSWPNMLDSNESIKNLILGMIEVDPKSRYNLTECLNHPLFKSIPEEHSRQSIVSKLTKQSSNNNRTYFDSDMSGGSGKNKNLNMLSKSKGTMKVAMNRH
eukprot:gene14783-19866_t